MQMREKLAYAFLLHFSALMLVFLFSGVVQLLLGPYLAMQLNDPVIAAMINIMKMNLNYPTEKLLIGMITFIFFLPFDLAILYWTTRELFERDDVMHAIEDGLKTYPLFLVFFSDMYFFSFVYPWFTPFVLFILFRFLEPDTDWKIHVVSTILVGIWFIPLALVGRIESITTRNLVSLLLYLALVFPFFVHSWYRSYEMSRKPAKNVQGS